MSMMNTIKLEEQEDLTLIPPTTPLEIDKDLTLLPRIKLNLTIHPSTLTSSIDQFQLKNSLLTFLQTSKTLPFPLPEEDLIFKRFHKDPKKRKRDEPLVYGTLHIWNLTFLNGKTILETRNALVDKINGIEMNLLGVKFRLQVSVSDCDDFEFMKKGWQEFYAFGSGTGNVNRKREPDTIVIRGVPSRWFAETRVSSKPSMLVTHTIFEKFGKIRCVFLKPYKNNWIDLFNVFVAYVT